MTDFVKIALSTDDRYALGNGDRYGECDLYADDKKQLADDTGDDLFEVKLGMGALHKLRRAAVIGPHARRDYHAK